MHAGGEVVALSALNSVVAACAQLADCERAQQTVDEMKTSFEMEADGMTYEGLMEAYGRGGKVGKLPGKKRRRGQEEGEILSVGEK